MKSPVLKPWQTWCLVLLSVPIIGAIVSLSVFWQTISPPRLITPLTPDDFQLPYESVRFTTTDGIQLAGWFIPHADADAPTIILLHGYPADKGNILPRAPVLSEHYSLLLFDFRASGESAGRISTVGAREVADLDAAITFLKDRGVRRIGAWGLSMGGAVALMAAANHPELQAIVAEAPYADLASMSREQYRIPVIRDWLGMYTNMWARLFLSMNPADVSPARAAVALTAPILHIHPLNDSVIPFTQATTLQTVLANNPQAQSVFPSHLRHGQLDANLQRQIVTFFQAHL